MTSLAIGSTHTYGSNSVPRYRHPLHLHATASCPTRATANHTLTTDEQACSPPRATWTSPPYQHHRDETRPLYRLHPQSAEPSSSLSLHPTLVFRVSMTRRLMLPHPAASDSSGVVLACPNKSAAGQICSKSVDVQQHHCYGCRCGGGVDRKHAAVARCLADVIHSHNGTKVYIEQPSPALTRVVNARMDLIFDQNGTTTCLGVAIVSPFSNNPTLIATASTGPSHMSKRAAKVKFDRYSHVNLVPFILDPTSRPGYYTKKFIGNLMKDADNRPLAIRDTWSAIQSVLHSAISKQQLTAAVR